MNKDPRFNWTYTFTRQLPSKLGFFQQVLELRTNIAALLKSLVEESTPEALSLAIVGLFLLFVNDAPEILPLPL